MCCCFFLSFSLDVVESSTVVATTACLIAFFWLAVMEPNPVLVESQALLVTMVMPRKGWLIE
jgi:hypothetical protein